MEATLIDSNTALEQFNFQLRQLVDTFQWIQQEHQTAAIATVESLVNELRHLSNCRQNQLSEPGIGTQEIEAQLEGPNEEQLISDSGLCPDPLTMRPKMIIAFFRKKADDNILSNLIPLSFGETAETLTNLAQNVLDSETGQSIVMLDVSDREMVSPTSEQPMEPNLTIACSHLNEKGENVLSETNENQLTSTPCSELTTLSSAQTSSSAESEDIQIPVKVKTVRGKRMRSSREDDGLVSKKLKDISNVHESSQRAVKLKRAKGSRNIAATGSSDVRRKGDEAATNAFPVSCRQCRGMYEDYDAFKVHMCKGDQHRKVFYCKHCNVHFKQPVKFQQHVTLHERNDCRICDTPFVNRKLLSSHTKLEHGVVVRPDRYYHCPNCTRKFIKRSSLYSHLKEHSDSKAVCVKCGHFCENDADLRKHLAKHAEEANFRCEKCDESFLRKQQYDQHMEGHEKYACDLCEDSAPFSTKKQLAKHRRVSHGIMTKEEKRHECQICHKKFQRPTLLEIHLRVHTGEKPIKCAHSDCDKYFRTYKSMIKHTATHAAAEKTTEANDKCSDKAFLCSHCAAKFHRKQGLLRHIQQLHCEDRPFHCPFCEYSCKCKTNLKRHIELHKDERRFVCELCGASFHAHATLKEHNAYVHSDVRGFVCGKCGKGFKGRSGLRRHIRSHSDDRPFVCDCGQSYKRKSHLKRHMMAVHKVRFASKRVQRLVSASDQSGASNNYDDTPFAAAQEVDDSGMLVYNTATDTGGVSFADLAVALELPTAQTISGPQEVITHLQLPSSAPHILQQTLQQQSHIPITIQASPTSTAHLMGPLTSLSDDLQHTTFDLTGSMPIAIPQGNITLSIPAGPSTSLVSLPQQPLYHTVQTLTSVATYAMDAKQPMNNEAPEFCIFE